MTEKWNQIGLPKVANQEPNSIDNDMQKLYDGFVVMGRIIAKEMAKEGKTFPDPVGQVFLSEKIVLSSSEAAKLLGVHVNTVLRWVQEDKILIQQFALRKQFGELPDRIEKSKNI